MNNRSEYSVWDKITGFHPLYENLSRGIIRSQSPSLQGKNIIFLGGPRLTKPPLRSTCRLGVILFEAIYPWGPDTSWHLLRVDW